MTYIKLAELSKEQLQAIQSDFLQTDLCCTAIATIHHLQFAAAKSIGIKLLGKDLFTSREDRALQLLVTKIEKMQLDGNTLVQACLNLNVTESTFYNFKYKANLQRTHQSPAVSINKPSLSDDEVHIISLADSAAPSGMATTLMNQTPKPLTAAPFNSHPPSSAQPQTVTLKINGIEVCFTSTKSPEQAVSEILKGMLA